MKILVLDNYDSFTYNLVHYIEQLTDSTVDVFRNDAIDTEDVDSYDKILLSPGPGIPADAGILIDVIKRYHTTKDIFGVCLGLQAIAEAFGGSLINLNSVFHGLATPVFHDGNDPLFDGLNSPFMAGRYHSWIADSNTLPDELSVTARDEGGNIMALRHKIYRVCGVQFHPESVLTPDGLKIIDNWLKMPVN